MTLLLSANEGMLSPEGFHKRLEMIEKKWVYNMQVETQHDRWYRLHIKERQTHKVYEF